MDPVAAATVLTTFGELMGIHDNVSGKSQRCKEHYKYKVALCE
jgi:hypothetical protein